MKEITLEMIDQFIEETGFSFDEARAYLLAAEGDLELAVEAAVSKDGSYSKKALDSFVDQVKELIRKGNLVRLVVRKNEEVLVNIPLGVGVLGALYATFFSAAALGVALVSGHDITLEKKDGKIINVKEYLDKSIKKAKDSGEGLEEYVKQGFKETKERAKGLKEGLEEKIHSLKDKSEEGLEDFVEKVEEGLEEAEEKAEDLAEDIKDKIEDSGSAAEEILEETEEVFEEAKEEVEEVIEEIEEEI